MNVKDARVRDHKMLQTASGYPQVSAQPMPATWQSWRTCERTRTVYLKRSGERMLTTMRAAVQRGFRRLKLYVLLSLSLLKDRRLGWIAWGLLALAAAYAVSPIDLIPDFIPVLGLLDEVILLPVLVGIALRQVPRGMITLHLQKVRRARRLRNEKAVIQTAVTQSQYLRWCGAAVVVTVWALILAFLARLIASAWSSWAAASLL
ncbi:MAG: YkvA family protein [Pseudomonadota bacterium]